jgi:hypothetical protein
LFSLKGPHPLTPAVLDRFGPFNRIDEILAESFFDDLFFLRHFAGFALFGFGVA